MQRYFIQTTPKEDILFLEGDTFHHVKNVMRNQVGDILYLVDSNQQTHETKITAILPQQIEVKIIQTIRETKELPCDITIASSFLKGEKMEWLVQKATELGMSAFVGFPSQTSVVKWDAKKREKKAQRLEKIALEASQQSQRIAPPTVTLLEGFQQLLATFNNYDHVLIAYEESSKQGEKAQLKQLLEEMKAGESLLVVFGPEGGITPAEMEKFLTLGAKVAALGPRILRAETAPLYLLSTASYQWELG